MDGTEIVKSLIARGYSPIHAAALAGHALQESGGSPYALNADEGAHGILQWRNDRWDNLQKFAKAQGKSPDDQNVQLDFIGHEMQGPEAKAGTAFRSATDLPSASAALKKFIRYGDNSDETRLNNARGLLAGSQTAPMGPIAAPAVAPDASAVPVATPAAPNQQQQLMALLSNAAKQSQASGVTDEPAPVPIQFARPPAQAAIRQKLLTQLLQQTPVGMG